MMGYYSFYAVTIVLSLLGMIVSGVLKRKFSKYSRVPLGAGLTGREVAQKMLDYYDIKGVQIVQSRGRLSDHYNPLTRTVNLSPEVYNGRSVASAAVAAHECGHVVQHATAYSMLMLRSRLVPVVNVAARMQQYLLIGAFILMAQFPQILLVAIAAFMITALFSFITLPVEFDASKRALNWLDNEGITQGEEYDGAKDALTWAAMTYVAAALSALVMVLYLVLRYSSRN